MIDVKEGNVFIGIWFVQVTQNCDMTGAAWKEEGKGPWIYRFRYRYYRDDKANDSNDEKRWYQVKFPEDFTEDQVKKQIEDVIRHSNPILDSSLDFDFVDLRGAKSVDEMLARMAKKSWMHVRSTAKGGSA